MAQQYTRKVIREVFVKMLNERPLNKITVKDIVLACEINRNTFYYYYIPCMMPYITAFFMPRRKGDRPLVTGMEAVYTLLDIDRGVPEVWGSVYDVRDLLNATVKLMDGKKITDVDLGFKEKMVLKEALKKVKDTELIQLLKEYQVI